MWFLLFPLFSEASCNWIYQNCPITQNVGKKLFAIGFAYKHCNVWPLSLPSRWRQNCGKFYWTPMWLHANYIKKLACRAPIRIENFVTYKIMIIFLHEGFWHKFAWYAYCTQVCTEGRLLLEFTLDDLMRIRNWHFAIRHYTEMIPRNMIVRAQDPNFLDQLSKNITRHGMTNVTLNYLRVRRK